MGLPPVSLKTTSSPTSMVPSTWMQLSRSSIFNPTRMVNSAFPKFNRSNPCEDSPPKNAVFFLDDCQVKRFSLHLHKASKISSHDRIPLLVHRHHNSRLADLSAGILSLS